MITSEQRTHLICSTSLHNLKNIFSKMKNKKFKWIYLGEDVTKVALLENRVGDRGKRIEIAQLLQETAHDLRQPYIEYIGKFSTQDNSLNWWASRLPEKNPFVSKAFLHICYLKVSLEILRKYEDEPLVVFVENREVKEAIRENITPNKIRSIEAPLESIFDNINKLKKFVMYKTGFLLYNIYRIMISKYIYGMQKQINSKEPLILVNTFINPRSFGEGTDYHENYFGRLYSYIKKQGNNIAIIPQMFRTVCYHKTIEKMRKSEHKFLVPHSFLSFSDVFRVFFRTFPGMHKKIKFPKFEDLEVHMIIDGDLKNDWRDNHVSFGLLFYHFIKRLKEKEISIERMIYTYENHAWEKVLCVAIRKYYPCVPLIAYQHAVFSRMSLSYFFSKKEYNLMPKPDRIITNGKLSREILIGSGYPPEKLISGGAIKYIDTIQLKPRETNLKKEKPIILVTPTLGKTSLELIGQVFRAFRTLEQYEIIIRCHPTVPFESISKYINFEFPNHITIAQRPFSELLKKSDVLIYTSSATCVEASAVGVPVIHVQSSLSLDLDPLDSYPKARLSVRDSKELVEGVKQVLSIGKRDTKKRGKEMNKLLKEFFGKIDDSTYNLFLKSYDK